jgi:hypothetical protein
MMGILHRGVKEFDGVCPTLAAELVALNRYLDADALEVDDDGKGDDGRDQVHNIGETIPPERLVESMSLVVLGEEEVEEHNNGAFEFRAAASVDGCKRESLPDDGFADVGSNEEGDTRAQAIAILQQLIEEDNNEGSDDE